MTVLCENNEGIRPTRTRATSHISLISTALLALTCMLSGSDAVAGDLGKFVVFDIKAQTLGKALLQFGAQADVRISFSGDLSSATLRTPEIRGRYTEREALTRLLRGTRLRYVASERTVEIIARPRPDAGSAADAVKSMGLTRPAGPASSTGPGRQIQDPPAEAHPSHRSQSAGVLEEIVVTAQKYRQTSFDVPISLQVLTGSELRQHAVTDLSDLQYDVPGLYMNSTGVSQQVFLRGVGNYFGDGAMVGEYIDDADITAESAFGATGYGPGDNELYDLQRVEVLKGPQGTLYGDGSMGGVIRYITNKPALDRFEMSSDVVATFTQYGAPSQRVETMLNTPLINGTLGVRFAGTFAHDGGWVDEPAANLKNVNGGNLADVRAEALWRPTESFSVNATQILRRNNYGLGTGEDAQGDITPVFGTTLAPTAEDHVNMSNLFMTYVFSGAKLISSSTYLNESQNIYDLPNTETIPPLPALSLLATHEDHTDEDFSEELRLADAGRGPWRWTIGAFYKDYRYSLMQSEYVGLATTPLSAAVYYPDIIDVRGSSRSLAEFADSSYALPGGLTLGAGVRYFRDRETSNAAGTQFNPAVFTSTDPRVYLQYRVTPHVNTYASVSKGFRSGGFNYLPTLPTYGPETLWSYDLGSKIRIPVRNLLADVDVFYSNYSHFVSEADIPPVEIGANVGNARITGVDADVTWRPVAHWKLGLNTELLKSEFLTATAVSGFAPGERLPYAPRYSFTASVARDFRWQDRPGDVEVYYYEISRVQYREAGYPLMQSDVLRFLNTRASVQWTDNLSLGVFVHNVLNDRGYESPFGPVVHESERPQPRTFGLQFDVIFD